MSEQIKVVITGFETTDEALEFCQWYSGQGEQNSSIWFESRDMKTTSMNAKSIKQTDSETISMQLEMF